MQVSTLILGAGAAGMKCAAVAARSGGKAVIIDHAKNAGDKIRISGGGRCNFTNMETRAANFISRNPHFCKSALARYTPADFIELISSHGLTYTEKTLGQLFCDQKSGAVIQVLLDEMAAAGVELWLETQVGDIRKTADGYAVGLRRGDQTIDVHCTNLVVATGGKSIPKMGATGLGYTIASQFDLSLIEPQPGLVPFTFTGTILEEMAARSGTSTNAAVKNSRARFQEGMLFTHRGLSGPSMLQISSYWMPGETIDVDFMPGENLNHILRDSKTTQPQAPLAKVLRGTLPESILDFLLPPGIPQQPMQSFSNARLDEIAGSIQSHTLLPAGTEGYRTAEVTVGGVDTSQLSSKTMETKTHRGLYFIGEVVDVTGWLGGYNFQWSWASAEVAGQGIIAAMSMEV